MKTMLTECPNCGSFWGPGSEEWQFQECDCCGNPDNMDIEDYLDEDEWTEAEVDDFYASEDEDLDDVTAHDPLAAKGITENPQNLEDE